MSQSQKKRQSRRTTPKAEPSIDSLLSRASRDNTADLRRVVKAKGIPVECWRALEVLSDESGRSMSELATALGMAMPATSKIVDRLTESALIQRAIDPADQRRVILYISDFGLEKVRSLLPRVNQYRQQVANEFNADQMQNLRELLMAFIAAQDRASQRR